MFVRRIWTVRHSPSLSNIMNSWFKSTVKTAKCHPHLQISHEAAKSIAKLISQLFGKLQPADGLSRADGAI